MDTHRALTAAIQSDDRIRLAVIFGSAARGTSSSQSDLDIGVLGLPVRELPKTAVHLGRVAGREVDLVDLASAPPLLRVEIARDGVLLFARPTYLWADFKGQALIDWWDWAPLARRFGAAAMARLNTGAR